MRNRSGKQTRFNRIVMEPGVVVSGQLDADAPRPIRRGIVIATCCPKPLAVEASSEAHRERPVTWHDLAHVKEDGTFTLRWIPKSSEMQLITICDGWVNKTTIAGHEGFVA